MDCDFDLYKDEAEFDITVEIQADSQVRDVMLTDVQEADNAAGKAEERRRWEQKEAVAAV